MKRIIVLALIVLFLLPCFTECIAQGNWTDEHSNRAANLIMGVLNNIVERLDEEQREKRRYEYLKIAQENAKNAHDSFFIPEEVKREITKERARIELENREAESEKHLQKLREINYPYVDCYEISANGELVIDQFCVEWKQLVSMRYVDLGLPSGTLWGTMNLICRYTYDDAIKKFENQLPTQQQFTELVDLCTWSWEDGFYQVIGPNGNSIYLCAAGHRFCDGEVHNVGIGGYYWSSTPYDSGCIWSFCFFSDKVDMHYNSRCFGQSVILVQNP